MDPDEYYFRTHVRLIDVGPTAGFLNDLLAVSPGRARSVGRAHRRSRGPVIAGPDGLAASSSGAGIGGLATALSLHADRRDGARSSTRCGELRPLGVGINLLPHAVRELDALGLLEELRARSVAPSLLLYCTKRGQEIWREPRGLAAGYPWPQLSIHRGVLQEVLLGRPGRPARGPKCCTSGGGSVAVDGCGTARRPPSSRTGGSRPTSSSRPTASTASPAAQHYPDEGPLRWNGSLLWRGVAETEAVLDGRTMIWAGHPEQKFVGYPIADLPEASRRSTSWQSCDDRTRTWPRPRTGTAGVRSDDFLPQFEDGTSDGSTCPPSSGRRRRPTSSRWSIETPSPAGRSGGAPSSGDAAHPMYPIGSNGASQAILDARVLAGCLRRHPDDLGEAWPLRAGPSTRHRRHRPRQSWARTRAPHAAGRAAGAGGLRRRSPT